MFSADEQKINVEKSRQNHKEADSKRQEIPHAGHAALSRSPDAEMSNSAWRLFIDSLWQIPQLGKVMRTTTVFTDRRLVLFLLYHNHISHVYEVDEQSCATGESHRRLPFFFGASVAEPCRRTLACLGSIYPEWGNPTLYDIGGAFCFSHQPMRRTTQCVYTAVSAPFYPRQHTYPRRIYHDTCQICLCSSTAGQN